MNHTKTTFAAAAALTIGLAVAGCSAGSDQPAGTSATPSTNSSAHNTQDVMFAQMMLPHHEQAVEMSDVLLDKGDGVDADVAALAEQITDEQRPEITTLTGWLEDWGADSAMSGMDHSTSGMMSESDMTALDRASAEDAGTLYLRQMVEHHTSAVDMARTEVDSGRNTDAVALAESIVSSQTDQIAQMQRMLASR